MSELYDRLSDSADEVHVRGVAVPLAAGSTPSSDTLLIKRRHFAIYLARTRNARTESVQLVEHMYRARGYMSSEAYAAPNGEHFTFIARNNERLFGTLTLRLDSATGLPADAEYRPELSAFRMLNRRLAELTRLAIDPRWASRQVIGSLFHVSYIFCAVRNVSDVFIEVHPRHGRFYTRMLRFHVAGDHRTCARVAAPARLLRIAVSEVAEHLRPSGPCTALHRTLYGYFGSHQESLAIATHAKSV